MNTTHYAHWPEGLPYAISTPDTSVYVNLEVSARRYPQRPAIVFYDSVLTYAQLHAEVLALSEQLCARDPFALRMMKANVLSAEELAIADFIEVETARQIHTTSRPDLAMRMAEAYRKSKGG